MLRRSLRQPKLRLLPQAHRHQALRRQRPVLPLPAREALGEVDLAADRVLRARSAEDGAVLAARVVPAVAAATGRPPRPAVVAVDFKV